MCGERIGYHLIEMVPCWSFSFSCSFFESACFGGRGGVSRVFLRAFPVNPEETEAVCSPFLQIVETLVCAGLLPFPFSGPLGPEKDFRASRSREGHQMS